MATHTNIAPQVERVIEVDAYEQELFDDVATLCKRPLNTPYEFIL